jgi:hypothetical protein
MVEHHKIFIKKEKKENRAKSEDEILPIKRKTLIVQDRDTHT